MPDQNNDRDLDQRDDHDAHDGDHDHDNYDDGIILFFIEENFCGSNLTDMMRLKVLIMRMIMKLKGGQNLIIFGI